MTDRSRIIKTTIYCIIQNIIYYDYKRTRVMGLSERSFSSRVLSSDNATRGGQKQKKKKEKEEVIAAAKRRCCASTVDRTNRLNISITRFRSTENGLSGRPTIVARGSSCIFFRRRTFHA